MTDDLITLEQLRELNRQVVMLKKEGEPNAAGHFQRQFTNRSADYVRQLLAQPAGSGGVVVPRGWKLVPTQLTSAMFSAWEGTKVFDDGLPHKRFQACYRAMLAAAPASPQGLPADATYIADVMPDWTTMQLPDGSSFAFKRENGMVYKLPHPDAPFIPLPAPPSSGDGRGVA